jgi:hypothetical protein
LILLGRSDPAREHTEAVAHRNYSVEFSGDSKSGGRHGRRLLLYAAPNENLNEDDRRGAQDEPEFTELEKAVQKSHGDAALILRAFVGG